MVPIKVYHCKTGEAMRLATRNESQAAEAEREAKFAGGKEWEAKFAGGKEWCIGKALSD